MLQAPFPHFSIYGTANMVLELLLFAAATIVMLKTRDFFTFFQPHRSNLLLAIPVITVLLPTFLGYPLQVPMLLALPHFFYLVVFSIAVLRGLPQVFKTPKNTVTSQVGIKKKLPKWITVAISTAIVMALLTAFAFLATPQIFQPSEIMVTGTVTAQGATPNRIVFVNTGCGTRTEAAIALTGEDSGTYAISLSNRYTYNVSLAWSNPGGALVETEIGTLVLDTADRSLVRDWTLQP